MVKDTQKYWAKLFCNHLLSQGTNPHMFDTSDKVNVFCKKIELWTTQKLEIFTSLNEFSIIFGEF